MSFNFGTPQQSFASTPTKPTGFAAPISFNTPATTATGFGGFGTTFAPSTTQQSGFGTAFGTAPTATAFGTAPTATAFGTAATGTAAPAFGTTFGTATTSAPPFGSTFGSTATSAPPFGNTFGTPATSASVFGTTFGAQTSAAPNLFGGTVTSKPLFGTPAATQPGLFGAASTPGIFGSTAPSQPNLFSSGTSTTSSGLFGAGATTTTAPSLFGGFGTAPTTSAPNLFGGGGGAGFSFGSSVPTSNAGFGLFGSTTTTAPSLFSGFGPTTSTTAPGGFGGFGTGFSFGGTGASTSSNLFGGSSGFTTSKPITTTAGFGPGESYAQQVLVSCYSINIFGDERDDILKKWNMLQACWGTGKGYYSPAQPPIDYNPSNPFYRLKAIGYVVIPERDNSDGLVKMIFNKKESELSNQREVLINGIGGILGNKPNLSITLEQVKALTDSQTEVMISVSEKGVTGTTRKIPASELSAFLNQAVQKQQLANVGVTFIGAYMTPSKAQLDEYLKNPPDGIEPAMWQAAQTDNPNPQKYLPAPVNGFMDLKKRMLCEEYETGLHRAFLEKVGKEIIDLKKKHAISTSQTAELKQKFLQLQHRVLRVLVKQEVTRKVGMALQPEEELLRGRLEAMHNQLNVPTQFRGQINEALSRVKMMESFEIYRSERYKMEASVQDDVKQFLHMEQNGIAHLINIINADLKNLKIISEGMNQLMRK